MKKLLLLFLLVAGGVSTASATDYYVSGDKRILPYTTDDWGIHSENKMHSTSVANVYALVVTGKTLTKGTEYLFKFVEKDGETEGWYGYDGGGNTTFTVEEDGTYTIIFYYNISKQRGRFIVTPMLRWDLGNSGDGNWSWKYEEASMLTRDGDFSWTYEILPAKFTKDTSIRLYSAAWNKSAYPNGTNISLSYGGGSVNSAYFNYTASTEWCWRITQPSYTFEKVVLTATYKPFDDDDFGQWEVSADAYISKTANGTNAGASLGYSTFGAETDVDLSSLPSGVTAETATVDAYGKITYNSATELAAGEGVLLTNTTGANVALSIPVKASAEAVAGNALRRVADEKLAQGDATYWHYILTKNTVPNNNADLGWYLVNEEGSDNLTIGTAYLQVAKITPSRGFYPLWSEDVTAIEKLTPAQSEGVVYDLQGRKVAQPTKGLYIVNGKKVIMK